MPKKRLTDLYHAGRVSCILNANAGEDSGEERTEGERPQRENERRLDPNGTFFLYDNGKDPRN